jgi:Type IV secretion system pilin
MKRVGVILIGVVAVVFVAAFFGAGLKGGRISLQPNLAFAATDPPGCPGGQAGPPSPTANYYCPNAGGQVVNGKYVPAAPAVDMLAKGSGGPVCIATPIFAGTQGACKAGETEIPNDPNSGGAVVFYLKTILKLLNALVGMVIILVLVIAGIQYITSLGDPARVKNAKKRITESITALILYMFMFAILSFLIPGGIL